MRYALSASNLGQKETIMSILCPTSEFPVCTLRACLIMQVLDTKVRKLEQLLSLKDIKIKSLIAKLNSAGIT